jgi:hypothetical protein
MSSAGAAERSTEGGAETPAEAAATSSAEASSEIAAEGETKSSTKGAAEILGTVESAAKSAVKSAAEGVLDSFPLERLALSEIGVADSPESSIAGDDLIRTITFIVLFALQAYVTVLGIRRFLAKRKETPINFDTLAEPLIGAVDPLIGAVRTSINDKARGKATMRRCVDEL